MVEDLLENLLVNPSEKGVEAFIENLILLEIQEQLPVQLYGIEQMRREQHIRILQISNKIINLRLRGVIVIDMLKQVVKQAFCFELAVYFLEAAFVEED